MTPFFDFDVYKAKQSNQWDTRVASAYLVGPDMGRLMEQGTFDIHKLFAADSCKKAWKKYRKKKSGFTAERVNKIIKEKFQKSVA